MDPLTIAALVAGLAQAILMAISKFGTGALDKPLREILPVKLRITLEREIADAAARERFGVPPADPYAPEPSEGWGPPDDEAD